jgi:hypothetical protein
MLGRVAQVVTFASLCFVTIANIIMSRNYEYAIQHYQADLASANSTIHQYETLDHEFVHTTNLYHQALSSCLSMRGGEPATAPLIALPPRRDFSR